MLLGCHLELPSVGVTLIDEAEGPGERLVKLFEPEVLPPEAGVGVEGDEGGDGGNDDQGL